MLVVVVAVDVAGSVGLEAMPMRAPLYLKPGLISILGTRLRELEDNFINSFCFDCDKKQGRFDTTFVKTVWFFEITVEINVVEFNIPDM